MSMQCPRCKQALARGRLTDHSILEKVHVCESCKGTFLGAKDLDEIEVQHDDVFFEWHHVPDEVHQQEPLTCPACNVTMNKVRSERDAQVIMDLCPQCNHTWLDGGELEALRTESLLSNLRNLFRGPKTGGLPLI
jgi:Zn-finger nucleic acid-binding protein